MRSQTIFILMIAVSLSSCVTRQYYLSPFQATNQPYRAMPMVSDSVKSGLYAGGVLTVGSANQSLRDNNFSFQGEIHKAHTFKNVQFNYGANLVAGLYNVNQVNRIYDSIGNPLPANPKPGRRFYSSAGAFAGVNLVIPFSSGSEWRAIGVESNFQQEFGDYQSFRKNLPDSFATVIQRQNYFHTIGITTNVIKRFRKSGNSFGYKLGIYFSTTRTAELDEYYNRYILPAYLSNTLHWTKDRVTGFAQVNLGSYAANFQAGASVRLGR